MERQTSVSQVVIERPQKVANSNRLPRIGGLAALALAGALAFGCVARPASDETAPVVGREPFLIPVVVVKYFPVKDGNIDISVTGDYGAPLEQTRKHTDAITEAVIHGMEQGSRYHGFKNEKAKPSLKFEIVKTYEFLDPLPTVEKEGHTVPFTDYNKVMARIDIKTWVEDKGVKEVWLYGYHGGVIGLWESNMAGPHGDISNSDRVTDDLPILKNTYTVYHYNYQRGRGEALEDHMHQLEAVLNYVDGRDDTPRDEWPNLLFWGKFVGSDRSSKMIPTEEGFCRCGWSHYPPNALGDYDWQNKRVVMSDIEDWRPDGTGEKKPVTSDIWGSDSYTWFIYWIQSIPGKDNGLTHNGKAVRNWWLFIAHFDYAMENKMKLTVE